MTGQLRRAATWFSSRDATADLQEFGGLCVPRIAPLAPTDLAKPTACAPQRRRIEGRTPWRLFDRCGVGRTGGALWRYLPSAHSLPPHA